MQIEPSELREHFNYEPDTGVLTWKCNRGHVVAGKVAGVPDKSGYIRLMLRRKHLLAHRVAWAIHYGQYPSGELDHINGVKTDNRISNLRDCTRSMNQFNCGRPSVKSKSGYRGVCFHIRIKKWVATIYVNGMPKFLGTFDSAEKAHSAYCNAAAAFHGINITRSVSSQSHPPQ